MDTIQYFYPEEKLLFRFQVRPITEVRELAGVKYRYNWALYYAIGNGRFKKGMAYHKKKRALEQFKKPRKNAMRILAERMALSYFRV